MTAYRLGVWTAGTPTSWWAPTSWDCTALAFQLLRDYSREDVSVLVQREGADGLWTTVLGLRATGAES